MRSPGVAHPHGASAAWTDAGAIGEPLRHFLFEPEKWVHPGWLASLLMPRVTPANAAWADRLPSGPWPTRWIHQQTALHAPLGGVDLSVLVDHWSGRLALLSAPEALRLGMVVSLLPFAGQLRRSMDGHLRRAMRQNLEDVTVEALDMAVVSPPQVRSTLPAGAWRQPDLVAGAGLQAAVAQACAWPDAVVRRFEWRFDPLVWALPASVAGLTMDSLEVACRALFPDHPWLWS